MMLHGIGAYMLRLIAAPVLLIAITLLATPVHAQNNWTGATSSDWATGSNWSLSVAPTAATAVNIDTTTPHVAAITAAGAQASTVYIGNSAGQTGTLNVTGPGTLNINSFYLIVGDYGTGNMTISSGGSVTGPITSVGNNAGSHGFLTVTGSGSQLTAAFDLEVGSSGTGTLTVEDGGTISASNAIYVGNDNGANGTIHLTGTTGLLTQITTNSLNVGATAGGIGNVEVTGADALLTVGTGNIGANAQGTVTLATGAAATFTNLRVGVNGTGTVNVNSGSSLTSTAATVGVNNGSSGTVNVSGSGSTWTVTNALTLVQSGSTASAFLNLTAGGQASAASVTSYGTVTIGIDGAGSKLTVTNTADFANAVSTEHLNITHGGALSATQINLADRGNLTTMISGGSTVTSGDAGLPNNYSVLLSTQSTGVSNLTLTDTGTTWTTVGGVMVGQSGTATATVSNGAVFNSGWVEAAENAGSSGTVIVQGAGSQWIADDGVHGSYIGRQGEGLLQILDGGSMTVGSLQLSGSFAPGVVGHGVILVSGSGSHLTTDELRLGIFGPGSLTIENGGRVDASAFGTGENSGIDGNQLTVTSGGILHTTGTLAISNNASAALTANTGATLESNQGIVGNLTGSTGTATLSDSTTTWTMTGNLTVGFLGHGILTVDTGAQVSTTANIEMGSSSSGNGELFVRDTGSSVSGVNLLVAGFVSDAGTASITLADGGAMTLTGTARLFTSGTLNIGEGGAAGSFSATTLRDDGLLHFNHTGNATFAVPITGAGDITKDGSGTTYLTADSSAFTGSVAVNAGSLRVNGSLESAAFDINSGGALGGNGTVGSVSVHTGGILAPGNSIDTLHVTDNVTFDPGSIYQIEVDASGLNDLTVVTGSPATATINGGTVQVLPIPGSYDPTMMYTILTAPGGVTGTFTDVTSNLAFLDPALTYDATNVYLTLTRNSVSFASVARSPNQRSVATSVEAFGLGNSIVDAITSLSDDQAQAAFDQLGGEIHSSIKSVFIEESRYPREAAINRVRRSFADLTGPLLADADPDAMPAGPVEQQTQGLSFWARGLGSWGAMDGDGNAGRLTRSIGGFFLGADAPVAPLWRVGLLGGYTHSNMDVNDRNSDADVDSFHAGLYGGTQQGPLGIRLGAAYAWHDVNTTRDVAFPGFTDHLTADYHAQTVQGFAELGYALGDDAFAIEPFVNAAYVYHETDGFSEGSSPAALAASRDGNGNFLTTVGLRPAAVIHLGDAKFTAHGMIGWRHAYGDVSPDTTFAFTSGSTPFTVAGVPIARDALAMEAGIDFKLTQQIDVAIDYSGQVLGDVQDNGVHLAVNIRF